MNDPVTRLRALTAAAVVALPGTATVAVLALLAPDAAATIALVVVVVIVTFALWLPLHATLWRLTRDVAAILDGRPEEGRPDGLLAPVVAQVRAQREALTDARQRLDAVAEVDGELGLRTARALRGRVASEVERVRRHDSSCALLRVVAPQGSRATLAPLLLDVLRPQDVAGVIGDDVVALLVQTDAQGAEAAAERVVVTATAAVHALDPDRVAPHAVVAAFPQDALDADDLVAAVMLTEEGRPGEVVRARS